MKDIDVLETSKARYSNIRRTAVLPVKELLPEYQHIRNIAARAAQKAGQVIRDAVGKIDIDAIRSKGIHDLVTEIDKQSEDIIVDVIHGAFPDHHILAEESYKGNMRAFEKHDSLWIVDPIDGTTNFIHGVPPYAVSIAYRHRGELVVGVVYDVAHDELFTAIKGSGLLINGSQGHTSKTTSLSESLISTGFPFRAYDHIDQYLAVLKRFMRTTLGVRRHGSAAVDLAWVAAGRFDAFFETGLMPWDVAAGIVLVREAGGQISDYSGNPEPSFTAQIVASNGYVHDETLDFVSPMVDVYD
jgi:myo-inositol-1(or 4)-monophosphatase